MKIFQIGIHGTFQITGKGTVITVHRDENDVEGIEKGSILQTTDDGKYYRVVTIEMFKNMRGDGKNIGLLVTEIPKPETK
jgi:translation elongation factor EF-Tu-like GTPase